jgi:anti-anti-sigma regulatory factor
MMEAVRPSQITIKAPPLESAPPKLTIEKFADGGITCLKFSGTIDEGFDGKKLGRAMEGDTLVLDLGGVKKISSFGIREWVDFVSTASAKTKSLVLIECAPKVVDQLNMVANFAGGGRVFSFYAPFRCDYCDSEHRALLELARDFETLKTMKLGERPCPSCKESMYFDEDGSTYFSYVLGQGPIELEPDIIAFLAAKLDYRLGTIDSKVRVDKVIDGRITYLRLSGDLNNTFPRDKLAEGLEGTVIADVTGITRVEPAGAAEWRSLVQAVAPLVEQLLLIGVTPAFLEKLCGKDDLGAKAQVVDFTLPYACKACGTTSARPIVVAEHHDVIKFATAPELRCPSCKAAMQCMASETAMTVLPGLPKPAINKELERQIAELRGRKLEKKPSIGMAAVSKVEEARSSPAVPILLGLLLIVVIAGGAVFYMKSTAKKDPGPYGIGPVVASSAKTRPAWIRDNGPVSGMCALEQDHGVSCIGVSAALASQEEAEDEASDAATEAFGWQVGRMITEKDWLAALPALFVPARDAAIASYGRDPQSTQAKRDLHDGRHAVARAFHGATPKLSERYWEAFDTNDGRRYVAFARIAVPVTELNRRAAAVVKTSSALGATVTDFFPELGWRFTKLDHGAVVTKLEHGILQDLGLAEHYVVIAVNGRDVLDAAGFEKIIGEEHERLSERGGSLRLLVQTENGDPREFSTTIAGRRVEVPTRGDHGTRNTGTHDTGSGGVNVWDRFGGNRGSGRDDPTQ